MRAPLAADSSALRKSDSFPIKLSMPSSGGCGSGGIGSGGATVSAARASADAAGASRSHCRVLSLTAMPRPPPMKVPMMRRRERMSIRLAVGLGQIGADAHVIGLHHVVAQQGGVKQAQQND